MIVKRRLIRIGSSEGITLEKKTREELGLKINDMIEIEIKRKLGDNNAIRDI